VQELYLVKLQVSQWLDKSGEREGDTVVIGRYRTIADAEKWAREDSEFHVAVTPLRVDSPVYVYRAESCEPVSVWVKGVMVRLCRARCCVLTRTCNRCATY
jgi:hypothetical protein